MPAVLALRGGIGPTGTCLEFTRAVNRQWPEGSSCRLPVERGSLTGRPQWPRTSPHGPWRDRLHDARDFLGAFLRRATLDGTRRGVRHRPPEASGPPPRESDLLACVNYYQRSAAPCRARRPPSPSPSTSATWISRSSRPTLRSRTTESSSAPRAALSSPSFPSRS